MIIILVIALVALVGVIAVVGVNGLFGILLSFLYYIAKWFLMAIDFCQSFMRRLCGLEGVTVEGESEKKDILFDMILNNKDVQTALLAILALSIILVFGFAMVQIIRLEYTTEGSKNAKGPIIKKCIKTIFLFCLIPFCAFIGIYFSNQLIGVVDAATNTKGNSSIAGTIFIYAAKDANIIRNQYAEWSWCGWGHFGDVIKARIPLIGGDLKYDSDTGILYDGSDAITGGETKLYKANGGKGAITGASYVHSDLNDTDADKVDDWFSMPTENAYKVQKSNNSKAISMKNGEAINFTNAGAVKYFYNLNQMDYFMLFVAGWFCLKIMFSTVFGLVMRLYKVAVLFIVSPFPVAMTVIDDGASLNKWKSKFLGETFSAYAVVAGMNIFLMLLPVFSKIKFFDEAAVSVLGLFSSVGNINILSGFALAGLFNKMCQMVIILVGCYMIKDIIGIISDLLGTGGNVVADGEGMQKNIGETVAKAGSVAMGGLTLAAAGATAIGGKAMASYAKLKAKGNEKAKGKQNKKINKLEDKNKKLEKDHKKKQMIAKEHDDRAAKIEAAKGKNEDRINELINKEVMGDLTATEEKELESRMSKRDQYDQDIEREKNAAKQIRKSDEYTKNEAKIEKAKKRIDKRDKSTEKLAKTFDKGTVAALRGKSLIGNAVVGTKVAQYINKGTMGMLTAEGRGKLDKQVAGIDDDTELIMKRYSKAKGQSKAKTVTGVNGQKVSANSRKGYSKDNAFFESAVGNSEIIKNVSLNADPASYNQMADTIANAIKSIESGKYDDVAVRDLIANRASAEEFMSTQDPTKAKAFKDMLDSATKGMASRRGSKDRNDAMAEAAAHAKDIRIAGGVVKIDGNDMKNLIHALTHGNKQAALDPKYGQELVKYVEKAISKANDKVNQMKTDSKQDNLVADLLRQLIEISKGK